MTLIIARLHPDEGRRHFRPTRGPDSAKRGVTHSLREPPMIQGKIERYHAP
jgi:hypothetical protein